MKLPPRLKISLIVILLIAFFVVLNLTSFSKEVKNFFYSISSPIQKSLWKTGDSISDFFEAVSNINKLKKEADELRLQNQELLQQILTLKYLKEENKFLREALDIGLEKEFELVLAQVIGKDISQDSILIDKGSKDGISEKMPVITQQKALVGKISEVYKDFSKVMLISNKESSFDTKVQEKEAMGIVKGKGSFRLFLDFVPSDIEIEEGDILVTTSLGGIFPKGLLVGQIKEVKESDIEPFQEAEIRQAFDIGELESLFIITEF